ncbi:hypothetical protein [Micromonospora sp. NPDC005220]|uniref:hypothetical protein n=1 Tax=Micromonospora sp. NPDC005220 TaxID=3155589 RepID=UPI0033AE1DF8
MKEWKGRSRRKADGARSAWKLNPGVPLRKPDEGDVLVSASIGPEGDLVALWSNPGDEAALRSVTTQPGWATFPDPTTDRPVAGRWSRQAGERIDIIPLPGLTLAHPSLQPLPHGRVLVVGARCRWRPDGPDHNAVIYDGDGNVEVEATLGDGIEHIFTTTSGEVWVGYFDEGVYGNYGWGNSDTPPPIGATGLIRFTPELKPAWRFPSHVDNGWGAISDCYALNVTDDAVWTCYYTDFPVVRVSGDEVTGWRNPIDGARALTISGDRVGLLGGYGHERYRFVVGALDGEAMRVIGEYQLVLPDGAPLPPRVTAVGRGPVLHLITADRWYQVNLQEAPGG